MDESQDENMGEEEGVGEFESRLTCQVAIKRC